MIKCNNCAQEISVNTQTCGHCNALVHTSPIEYFYTPTIRLLLFYCLTLGVYTVYWFYKNWVAVNKASSNNKIYPFLRSLFAVFFCWRLFDRIHHDATTYGYKHQKLAYTAASLFIIGTVLLFMLRISSHYGLEQIVFIFIDFILQLSALLITQRAIKFHNKHAIPSYSTKRQLTRVELVLTTVVCSWLALAIGLGLFLVSSIS